MTVNWWIMLPSIWLLLTGLGWRLAERAAELDLPLFSEGGHYLLLPTGNGCIIPLWFPDDEEER